MTEGVNISLTKGLVFPKFPAWWPEARTSLTVISLVLWVLIVAGNLFTVFVIRRVSVLHSATNYILASLAVADMLVGLTRFFMYIINRATTYPTSSVYYELARKFFEELPTICSIAHLLLVALDRFVNISFPLRYHVIVTSQMAKICIGITWVACAILTGLPIFLWPSFYSEFHNTPDSGPQVYLRPMAYTLYFLIAFFMAIIYLRIAFIARQHHVAILSSSLQGQDQGQGRYTNARSRMKATRKLSAILIAYLITWCPLITFDLIIIRGYSMQLGTQIVLYAALQTLGQLNSGVNVFLYAGTSQSFRKAYVETLKAIQPCTANSNPSSWEGHRAVTAEMT